LIGLPHPEFIGDRPDSILTGIVVYAGIPFLAAASTRFGATLRLLGPVMEQTGQSIEPLA
jgi:hypothetical protein